ncbi:DEAD/DEAH box helicase [Streptosporangium saharense]|uniref:DEAD/DEAH box helicase n=1 Tax=Streptosporangium saharense TaxID=1706840 RepID=UPI0036A23A98
MPDHLDPLVTSELISNTYRRYLRSLLPVRDPKLDNALGEKIRTSPLLVKGPYLEATPPYETGVSIAELITEGVLDSGLRLLESKELPLDRPLYCHQETAVRKAVAGRNIVVATGTGSGKTESFLLPILNELSRQHRERRLGPGVRALLLYPMNALANDQMKRLRKLLANAPHLTFGRYTGDTEESPKRARDTFEALNPGEELLPNELLSREEMRETPPHILLTNYAMLEYLLLRPADMELFEGTYAGHWRFIAVDEAHVYDGAKAAEFAMLLRRLHDRVAPGRRLQCLATSATVGDDASAVTRFATSLFNAPFSWVDTDPGRQDLVRAIPRNVPIRSPWGRLSDTDYRELAKAPDLASAVVTRARRAGASGSNAVEVLQAESRMSELRQLLAGGPRTLDSAARLIFDDAEDPHRAIANLVDVGSRLLDSSGNPALSARYHLFTRATEGAYTCLSEQEPHVSLGRRERCERCSAAVFEFAACQRCGTVYLTGTIRKSESPERLVPRGITDEPVWLRLGDGQGVHDEDDDAFAEIATQHPNVADVMLCSGCGVLNPAGSHGQTCQGCGGIQLRRMQRFLAVRSAPPCLGCGLNTPNAIRRFESGENAAPAVVATALYQSLPPTTGEAAEHPGEGRKLLMFSDSRQAAAFFAPYLSDSYTAVQHRRLIWEGLRRAVRHESQVNLNDLIETTSTAALDSGLFPGRKSAQERRRTVALWIVKELFPLDDRHSLEGRGLLRVTLDRDPSWSAPAPLLRLGLDAEESWNLLTELVQSVRLQGAITMPDGVAADDESFGYRRGPVYVRGDGSQSRNKVISWLPTKGTNRRLDYVRRVLERLGHASDASAILEGCWRTIVRLQDGWFTETTDRRLGSVRRLDHTWLLLSAQGSLFQCTECRRLATVSVRGVCTAIRCAGTLEPYLLPLPGQDDDHYRTQYRTMRPVPLKVAEHTAQWSGTKAAEIQQKFVHGALNALSCSTTFELGVDVGELQSVLLRNMPPTTANYIQRAGRAGRRAAAAALVVTYAQRRSHDLSRFQQPEEMIAGRMRAPYVPLGNERIDRRHAHSVALAAFFRQSMIDSGKTWRTAGEFFLPPVAGESAPSTEVASFLKPVPDTVRDALQRILPASVQKEIDLNGDAWVGCLTELLEDIRSDLDNEVKVFEERCAKAAAERKFTQAKVYNDTLNTLRGRDLIGFLANRNVLPKYGFPVDVVELRTAHCESNVGLSLELSRDLSSAIYEYAPGSEVVAGGVLWRSAGVHRLPDKELYGRKFIVCPECRFFQESLDEPRPVCPSCDQPYPATTRARQYVIPEFGFVAAKKSEKPRSQPPMRSWRGNTYVLASPPEVTETVWRLGNGGRVTANAGARGRLIAISESVGGAGHLICERCGWGTPVAVRGKGSKAHRHPVRDTECTGRTDWRTLAHPYETDLLELVFDTTALPVQTEPILQSLLAALLEGAAERLQISRDDIDGALHPKPGRRQSLVVYDTVPGGAGNAMRIAERLDEVLEGAFSKVESCDCGEETSCYACLRTFRNQWIHERLRRGAARDALAPLLPVYAERPSPGSLAATEFTDLVASGLVPPGTILTDTITGTYSAQVLGGEELLLHGAIYPTPQNAADAVEQDADSWTFWAAELPEGPVVLEKLRQHLPKP